MILLWPRFLFYVTLLKSCFQYRWLKRKICYIRVGSDIDKRLFLTIAASRFRPKNYQPYMTQKRKAKEWNCLRYLDHHLESSDLDCWLPGKPNLGTDTTLSWGVLRCSPPEVDCSLCKEWYAKAPLLFPSWHRASCPVGRWCLILSISLCIINEIETGELAPCTTIILRSYFLCNQCIDPVPLALCQSHSISTILRGTCYLPV